MADVVKIRSGIALEGSPDPELVSEIENLLQEVKSGRVKAVAIGAVVDDNLPNTRIFCEGAYKFELACAVGILHHRIFGKLLEQE